MNTRDTYALRSKLLKENGYSSYDEYLRSPEWVEIKNKICSRKGRKWNFCNVCGGVKNLNVHHSSYKVIGTTNPGNTVKVLCQECHKHLHDIAKGELVDNFYDAFRELRKIRVSSGLPVFEFPKTWG